MRFRLLERSQQCWLLYFSWVQRQQGRFSLLLLHKRISWGNSWQVGSHEKRLPKAWRSLSLTHEIQILTRFLMRFLMRYLWRLTRIPNVHWTGSISVNPWVEVSQNWRNEARIMKNLWFDTKYSWNSRFVNNADVTGIFGVHGDSWISWASSHISWETISRSSLVIHNSGYLT